MKFFKIMNFINLRQKKVRYIGLISLLLITIYLLYYEKCRKFKLKNEEIPKRSEELKPEKVILWWSPIKGKGDELRTCGINSCFFTKNRKLVSSTNIFVFYGSSIEPFDFPLPRSSSDIWILMHEESPKNIPLIMFQSAISLFNYTSTFSRFSHIPLTLNYLESLEDITDPKYFKTVHEKSKNIAPVLYLQSICTTLSNRDNYVKELGKYVEIDSYGGCLNNRTLNKNLSKDYLNKIFTNEFYDFVSQYKFMIAYENAGCEDYITEKLWRTIKTGVVPIYFGSPSVEEWMPNEKSIINVRNFESPKDLGKYINYLNSNNEEYKKILHHKYRGAITNKRLLTHKFFENNDFVKEFECFICENYDKILKEKSVANQSHYNCPKDGFMPKYFGVTEDLTITLKQAECEADIFRDFVMVNKPFNSDDFLNEMLDRYKRHEC